MNPLARYRLAWLLLLLVMAPGTALAKKRMPSCGYTEDRASPPSCRPRDEHAPVREVEHRVEARLEGDLVHLSVYRTYHNASPRYLEWKESLELPRDGTVHGLALESGGKWTEGVLLPDARATRRYSALKRKGTAAPATIARLSDSLGGLDLLLWNMPPRASVTVRYDVRVRLRYSEGRSFFAYPPARCAEEPGPSLTVAPPSPDADVRVERGDTEQQLDVLVASWKAEPFRGLDARMGTVTSGTSSLGFLQVRAGRLSEAPSRARVVFVLDASHSVGSQGIPPQLALADAYLQFLPDARVEVVVFRRSAERLFGRFIPTSEWKAALAAVPSTRLAPGNGSHLDEGLKLAQQVLTEGSGPARVVALSDGRLRRAFAPIPPAPTTSAPEAAVHLVTLSVRWDSEQEKRSWPIVREACGMPFRATTGSTLEALVRPLRLEQVRLEDARGARLREWPSLDEGEELQAWLLDAPPSPLLLHGQAWGCPSSTPVELDPVLSADLGRAAYAWNAFRLTARNASEKEPAPPQEVVDALTAHGDWVSPERSLLAVPSGAGPSSARTRELPDTVVGGVVGGMVGGIIACSLSPPHREDSPKFGEELTRLLQPVFSACLKPGDGSALRVRVETTGDELVDVEVTGADSEAQATCVREATWALRLPPLFDDKAAASYTLQAPRRASAE